MADPADTPLIQCSECGQARVVRRVSKQEWSYGQAFYYCPFYKLSGSVKIKFYQFLLDPKLILGIFVARWNRMSFLEVGEGVLGGGVRQENYWCFIRSEQCRHNHGGSTYLKMNVDGGPRSKGWVKREDESAEMVKEVVMVLKAIFVVRVALLLVLILVLFVLLVK